jgi:catechol 2,3-dioxygenase-like lactoylglutathione lyase family enzyme
MAPSAEPTPKEALMLGGFDLVPTLPARDIERAKRWYAEKLGFEPESEDPGGVHYRSGSTRFDIYPTQFAGTGKHTLGGWSVDDVDKVVTGLRERGVTFEEYDFPGLKTVDGVADLGNERGQHPRDLPADAVDPGGLSPPSPSRG